VYTHTVPYIHAQYPMYTNSAVYTQTVPYVHKQCRIYTQCGISADSAAYTHTLPYTHAQHRTHTQVAHVHMQWRRYTALIAHINMAL